jgi:hypothetical protein
MPTFTYINKSRIFRKIRGEKPAQLKSKQSQISFKMFPPAKFRQLNIM